MKILMFNVLHIWTTVFAICYDALTLVFMMGFFFTSFDFISAIFKDAREPIFSLRWLTCVSMSRLLPLRLAKLVALLPSQVRVSGLVDQRECWHIISVLVWPWQVWRQ